MAVPARQRSRGRRYAKDLLDVATMPREQVLDLLRLATSLKKKHAKAFPIGC